MHLTARVEQVAEKTACSASDSKGLAFRAVPRLMLVKAWGGQVPQTGSMLTNVDLQVRTLFSFQLAPKLSDYARDKTKNLTGAMMPLSHLSTTCHCPSETKREGLRLSAFGYI